MDAVATSNVYIKVSERVDMNGYMAVLGVFASKGLVQSEFVRGG